MKTMVGILLGVGALFVVSGAVIMIVGALLPRQHQVSRSIVLQQSPATIYSLLRDFVAAPGWRKDVKRVEMLTAEESDRVRFREYGGHGSVTYEVVTDVAGEHLVTRIVDTNLGYTGSWDYRLSPAAAGTRLTITENGDVTNIFFRFMSRFVFGHTATIDRYLHAVAAHFGERDVGK